MSGSSVPSHRPHPSRWRFSLAGLFILVVGISAGLGWWRLQRETGEALLAGGVVWFAMGMLQQGVAARRRWALHREAPPEVRFGWIALAGSAVGIVLLIALASVAKVARLHGHGLPDSTDLFGSLAFTKVLDAVFFFAILGGYLLGSPSPAKARSKAVWRRLVAMGGVAVGTAGLVLVVLSTTLVAWLVHLAVQGVQNALPIGIGSYRFASSLPYIEIRSTFMFRAAAAAVLLVFSLVLTNLMSRSWHRGLAVRAATGAAATISLLAVAWLVWWCHRVGFPTLSPFLAEHLILPSAISLVLSIALVATAVTALALRIAAEPGEDVESSSWPSMSDSRTFLHYRGGVMAVLLVGALWDLGNRMDLWDALWRARLDFSEMWSHLLVRAEYGLLEPHLIFRMALIALLARALWRRFRRTDDQGPVAWKLLPGKFAATWLLSLAVVVLAGPVAAWSAFAMLLASGMS